MSVKVTERRGPTSSLQSTNLADLLERVLDKGIVVAGDIKVKIVDIELLTIQLRLVVCSIERAQEIGLDWWSRDPALGGTSTAELKDEIRSLRQQVAELQAAS